MNFDMSDQKKAFWDGFFSVFNFGSFFDDSKIRISQKDYLLSLIKDRDEDLVNLRKPRNRAVKIVGVRTAGHAR